MPPRKRAATPADSWELTPEQQRAQEERERSQREMERRTRRAVSIDEMDRLLRAIDGARYQRSVRAENCVWAVLGEQPVEAREHADAWARYSEEERRLGEELRSVLARLEDLR